MDLRIDTIAPQDLSWDSAVRQFLLRCRSKNVSPATLALYARVLRLFTAWAASRAIDKPADVTPPHLRDYLDGFTARGSKDTTRDVYFRSLRTAFRFWFKDGLLLSDAMAKVERPRCESRLIRPFTAQELRSLLATIPTKTALGIRDHTITVLITDTALRVSECLGLNLNDVDLAAGTVRVLGKGRKERMVPFGNAARRALLQWLQTRGEIPGVSRLFVNRWGQVLTTRTYARNLRDYGRDAGLDTTLRCSPHTLRHTAALFYLRNGGDCLSLMRLLGHTDLAMTRRYVALTSDDLVAKHRQASPLDNLGGALPGEKLRARLK